MFDSDVDSSLVGVELEQLAEKHLSPASIAKFYHYVDECDVMMARIILFGAIDRRFLLSVISFDEACEAWEMINLSPGLVAKLRSSKPQRLMA